MERGDLCGAIRRDAATPRLLGWNGRGRLGRRIALDVARGLAFLHYNNVIHLDLKSPVSLWLPVDCISLPCV